jgi:hypothetical protein
MLPPQWFPLRSRTPHVLLLEVTVKAIAFALVLSAFWAAPLSAQEKPQSGLRHGFWIGFGVGRGSAAADSWRFSRGSSMDLRLGWTLSPSVLVGIEANGVDAFVVGSDTVRRTTRDRTVDAQTVVVLWYPRALGAFYFKVGVGQMHYADDDTLGSKLSARAAAGSFGLGYEFRVWRNLWLNLFLNALASTVASPKLGGVYSPATSNITVRFSQLGLGLILH